MLHFNSINTQTVPAKAIEALLTLKPNQLLLAKILEIFPDQSAKVSYNGHTFHAKLEAPLTKGNRYLFEVKGSKDSVLLKKIDLDTVKPTNEQILQRWNLPKTSLFLKAVDFTVSEETPLTRDNLKVVAEVLKETSSLPVKDTKEVIKRILQENLTAQPATVKAVIATVQKSSGFQEVDELFRSLVPLQNKHPGIAKAVAVLQEVFGYQKPALPQETTNVSQPKTANPQETVPHAVLTPKLASNEQKSVQPEFNSNLTVQNAKEDTISQKPAAITADRQRTDSPSEDFMMAVEKWIKKSGVTYERNILSDPVQLKHADSVKSILLGLLKDAESSALPETVLQKAESALNKVTSMQLQNVPVNDGMQQFTLQIPFGQGTLPNEITVRWEGKKKKGEPLDADHCRMLFWLEMKNLNEIAVDVQIQNRIVSLKVYNDYPDIQKLGNAFVGLLKKKMQDMNYTLSSVSFVEKQTKESMKPEPVTSYKGMDLRI
jgi:hypothetical protein